MNIFNYINPIAIQIGPLAIHWYGISYVISIIIGWAIAKKITQNQKIWGNSKSPISNQNIDDSITWIIVGIIIGGRLGYVMFYDLQYYITQPTKIIAVWDGGMSFHGGVIGTLIAIVAFARKRKIPVMSMFDIVTLCSCVGLFAVRLANFVNAELWGKTTNLPWGIVFPNAGEIPRHPSQIYEAMLEGAMMFAILLWLVVKKNKLQNRGFIAGMWLIIYAITRIIIETVREPDAHIGYIFANFITMGMILSIPMIAIGVWAVVNAKNKIT